MSIFENLEEIEQYSAQNIWGDQSIDLLFRLKTQTNRTDIGLSGYSICEDQVVSLSYAQIQTIVDKLAQQFLFSGLRTGDVLALQLPNSIESHMLYLACWQQNLIVAPLPVLWREADVKQALIRISPQAFICPIIHDGFNYSELMYQIGFDISSLRVLFSLGGNTVDGCLALDEFFIRDISLDLMLLKPDDYIKVDANNTCFISFAKDSKGNNLPYYHTHNQLIAAANIFNCLANPQQGHKICSPFPPTSMAICAITTVSWSLSQAALICHDGLMATEFQDIEIDKTILMLPATFNEPNLIEALFSQGLTKLIFIGKVNEVQSHTYFNDDIIDITTFKEFAFLPLMRTKKNQQITNQTYSYNLLDGKTTDSIELTALKNHTEDYIWRISCSFLPSNVIKVYNKYTSDIPYNVDAGNNTNVTIGNMALNYADLERELLNYHGVEDVAILAIEDKLLGQKPIIAIVPKVGAVILHHELVEYLKSKHISPYKIPQELYKIPEIPRDYDGTILYRTSKQQLLKLVGPKSNGPVADGLLAVQQELASLLADAQ